MVRPSSLRTENSQSNLYPDNSANDKVAHGLQSDASDDQGVPQGVGEKRLNEARVDEEHEDHNHGGQSHEQGHGEASLGGVDADLAQDLKAFANDVREVVKNLGEIAAGFELQHHRPRTPHHGLA